MARTVAGRRDQGDFIAEPGIAGDEVGEAGIDDRLHGVVENRCLVGLVTVVAPILIFGFAERVARVGEGRHPFVADELCVPADVIDMQMRACRARCRCCQAESLLPSWFRGKEFSGYSRSAPSGLPCRCRGRCRPGFGAWASRPPASESTF